MASRLTSSLLRCSIPMVSFIYRSPFYSTSPLISRTSILRNLISKPCCPISIRSVSSKSLASENDKIKRADENLLRVLESEFAEKESQKKVLPKDFQFEIIDKPEDGSVTLKREYDGEHIQATLFPVRKSIINVVVTIDKKVGSTLVFKCRLTPNDFEIKGMSLKSSKNTREDNFQGFVSCDSDEALQSACQAYLAERGFKNSLYGYLYYLLDRKNFAWQTLKEFIEK